MGYADMSSALAQLSLDLNDPNDAADIALLQECDASVSVIFEQRAGYDAALTPIWRGEEADVDPVARTVWGEIGDTAVLILPSPARTITDVQVAGEYPETLETTDWMAWNVDVDGAALSVRRIDGSGWPFRTGESYVTVTAHWSDGPKAEDPPAIVVNACTYLAVDEFRRRIMSPAGEIGPDLIAFQPRNPWTQPLVVGALEVVRPRPEALVF